jgi:bis(5'-nucleosidyl)-tetraphosphatase
MIQSAGIIVIDNSNQLPEPHVLVLRAYQLWDFPKGHAEEGESLINAAVRETHEETTLAAALDLSLVGLSAPSITYGSGNRKKTCTYYIADRTSTKQPYLPVSDELGRPENDEWRWVPVSQLSDLLPERLHPVSDYVRTWCATINVERKP